jgi:hypothetical protein
VAAVAEVLGTVQSEAIRFSLVGRVLVAVVVERHLGRGPVILAPGVQVVLTAREL